MTDSTRMPTHMMTAWFENTRPWRKCATIQPTNADDDDGEAAHRRRALLVHVVFGTAILLAEDRLALAAVAEERDEVSRTGERDDHRAAFRRS